MSQVSIGQNSKPSLTWSEEADMISLYATTEGFVSHRSWLGSWLGIALHDQIMKWLDNWERTNDTEHPEDLEFHQLLIRVNADIGMFHVLLCI